MDLGDVYNNNVSKQSISMTGTGGIPIQRERDPQLQKLENDVFSQMNQAIQPQLPVDVPPEVPDIQPVDFNQALKELLDMSKSVDDES